ncbi:metal ABC transporter solute-binding protein, Zn/Mn family [Fredinandcohnia sp. 179-A 10B2 NHS]|uniref:metal ABC transporter solute-binding protein, Zn/Mn family n=1 Tax=Fredinandcohnia sp. 179-A 10B2 NHS TaxID=3235176 RepID=UPI0039A32AF1
MKKTALWVAFLLILVFLYGCSSDKSPAGDEDKNESALQVYTTIFPVQDFTEKIGKEHVNVESVYPPNVDAHSYEPSTRLMTKIASADALIYNGAGIEGFVDAAAKALEKEDVKIYKASEGIEMLSGSIEHSHEEEDSHNHEEEAHDHEEDANNHDEEESHNHGDADPHVWLDPIRAITIAENIKNALSELKPDAAAEFEENYLELKQELESLDAEYTEAINLSSKKEILVAHAAYGYWERYGIEQYSITGMSPTQEPTQKKLTEIIETAKEHDIRYIIFEQNITSKVADVVKDEIGAEVLHLSNLESITEEDINNNEDYFSMMRKNLKTLKKALN